MEDSSIAEASPATVALFTSKSESITSEFFALIGFAARLGTCANNDGNCKAEKSVRDEAMLLMNLLKGKRASEILSAEIGVKDSPYSKRKLRPQGRDIGNFSFEFPSLSLQPDARTSAADNTAVSSADNCSMNSTTQTNEAESPSQTPSKLLSRTQCTTNIDGIRNSSESMARNVLESFGAALEWRAKTWIKSLATVLALREQKRIDVRKSEDEPGLVIPGTSTQEKENEDLMNSREMQIIDAIVKSSEEVSVVNIKTTFRVLPNRVSNSISLGDARCNAKKTKVEPSSPNSNEYKVTHKLLFEATISMTSNDGVRYNGVKLHAPGFVQGTFSHDTGSRNVGDEILRGVSMTLDTNALAQALERQSRLVVRKSAETSLVAAGGAYSNKPSRGTESPHVHHSVISPRYVLMSPMPARYQTIQDVSGLPQMPSTSELSGDTIFKVKNTHAVSSEGWCSSDSSANTTPSLTSTQSPSFPALLTVVNEQLRG